MLAPRRGPRRVRELPDLEQQHHEEHEGENGEARKPVEPAGDFLEQADQPRHVETFGDDAGDEDAVLFEPLRLLHIERLESRDVVDQPVSDASQRPGEHGGKDQNANDGEGEGEKEGNEFRDSLFEPFLERADDERSAD